MANDKNFKVKNGVEPTAYFESIGTVNYGSGTADMDVSTGSFFQITAPSDIVISLSNPAPSGYVSSATLLLDSLSDAHTITFDASIEFIGDSIIATPEPGKPHVLVFTTSDGGVSYTGSVSIGDVF